MTNEVFTGLAVSAVIIEALALIFALVYGNLLAVVLVNLVCSLIIFIVNLPSIGSAIASQDVFILLLVALAVLAVATNLLWFGHPKQLRWFVWIEFSIFTAISLALLIFTLTFKINRLF